MPKITKRLVEAAKPQDKDYIICDDDLAGFAVRILPSGRRSYIVQYRIGNRYRRMSLGAHGVLTPEKARRMAFKVLAAVKDGEDPAGERSRARKACTVKELAERFDQEHISVRLKPGTATEYRRNLRRFILPALGRLKVADVTRADVAKFHHDLRHIPYQANRNLSDYGQHFNPLLRCIVRRTRSYLESTINPSTGSYFLPKVSVKLFGEEDDKAIVLGGYLFEAYKEAEEFSYLLQQRVKGAGFFKTLLLRRLGSSMEAGRRTIRKLLGDDADLTDDEEDDSIEDDLSSGSAQVAPESDFKNFTDAERASLSRCLNLLDEGGNNDPKLEAVMSYLRGSADGVTESWFERGCILFSQYYDTVRWIGNELAKQDEFSANDIGLYAGSNRSGFWRNGLFQRCDRNLLKERVRSGELKLLLGTDAASEGLNLQRLGTLINIDLPWNPTRLEQRKGRIQRIGQARSEVWIANLRYRDSVEDRVHQVLADRLESIHDLFGQIPDTLEDVWVQVALNDEEAANQLIDRTTATRNPFDVKYSKVEDADWESCSTVLEPQSVKECLSEGWS